MSRFKIETSAFLRSQLTDFTDETRHGSEYCPHCGGYHSTDAEFRACADRHSPRDVTYACPRCGATHLSQGAANDCCADQKRYERAYYDSTYNCYTGIESESEPEPNWYEQIRDRAPTDPRDSGEGMFSSFFNFGGTESKSNSSSSSDGGIFSSFFDFGGDKGDDPKKGGGGFFGW